MNKVKWTELGGAPIRNEDWQFDQAGIADAIAGLVKIIGDNYILEGMAVSGYLTNSTTWTSGVVVLGGEVCRVQASVSPLDTAANPYVYVELALSDDPAGLSQFEDGTIKYIYQNRLATITAYSSAQVGKQSILTMFPAEQIINNKITDYTHAFTKMQSWAQGTDSAAVAGVSSVALAGSGNAFNLNIVNANVPLLRFTTSMPDGTWTAIRFTVGFFAIIGDGAAYTNGFNTGGKEYQFYQGETAIFIWMGGRPVLFNRTREAESWHNVGGAGEPAFQHGWANVGVGGCAFRVDDFVLEIKGRISNNAYSLSNKIVFNLGFTVPHKRTFPVIAGDGSEVVYVAVVNTNGDVAIEHLSATGLVYLNLDPIRMRIQ